MLLDSNAKFHYLGENKNTAQSNKAMNKCIGKEE